MVEFRRLLKEYGLNYLCSNVGTRATNTKRFINRKERISSHFFQKIKTTTKGEKISVTESAAKMQTKREETI